MSIARYFFSVPLMILFVAIFYVVTGDGGCWWPISDRSILVDVAFWKFSNNPPNSASVGDAITFYIMLHSTCTGPFSGYVACIGVLDIFPRKKYPPDLLRAYGSDM